jgi:tetratricopeptide (TPR) repeat protein
MADFNEGIRLDPTDPLAYSNRGQALVDQQKYAEAVADFDKAIELDPEDASTYAKRGLLWALQQKYDKALADFNESVRVDPKADAGYAHRAWLWATCPELKYRDGKRAVESATRACELTQWKDDDTLDTMAAACAEAGDFDSAVKWETKALDLVPKDSEDAADYRERLALYQQRKPYHEQ